MGWDGVGWGGVGWDGVGWGGVGWGGVGWAGRRHIPVIDDEQLEEGDEGATVVVEV